MSEWLAFVELGLRHITDPKGADHILFLVALAAVYRLRDWREAAWVATAFTIGHSITLALAVTGLLSLPTSVIEFLIPVTIVATTADNVLLGRRLSAKTRAICRPALAAAFGLVHGAGFANYLRSLFVEPIAIPLFGFNIGLEIGQIAVLTIATLALSGADRVLAIARTSASADALLRLRTAAVSACVAAVAVHWAAERVPW